MPVLSIERVVVLLTPLFGAAATWLVTLVATNVPGAPHLDPGAIEGIEIAVFLGTVAIVGKWLHGRQIPAIAKLAPDAPEIKLIEGLVAGWLEQNAAHLQGPPGPAGVTAEQVRQVAHDEVSRVLSSAAQSQPQQ